MNATNGSSNVIQLPRTFLNNTVGKKNFFLEERNYNLNRELSETVKNFFLWCNYHISRLSVYHTEIREVGVLTSVLTLNGSQERI